MFTKRSRKLISIVLILSLNPGMVDDQNKKFKGVIIKADIEVIAVNVTDRATLPRASNEKKLEALPPGQAATRIIPSAMPCGGDQSKINRMVSAGKSTY